MTHGEQIHLLDEVRTIVRAAGDAILRVYESEFAVDVKDDRSPLTEADRVAHEILRDRLAKLEPRLPVLSEESQPGEVEERLSWERYWLVDPLDGTKEFVKRNGEFTVNVALVTAHRAVLGVVLAPALGLEYWGALAAGAWKRASGEPARSIAVQPTSEAPLRVVGSRSHPSGQLAAYLASLGSCRLVPMGSSLKICLVAEGAADLYPRLGPTSEWDTAAAQAILESAGGGMMDTAGRPLRYNSKVHLINPHFLAFGDRKRDWLAGLQTE